MTKCDCKCKRLRGMLVLSASLVSTVRPLMSPLRPLRLCHHRYPYQQVVFFPFAWMVTFQLPPCFRNMSGSLRGTLRLLSKRHANSFEIISKTGNKIAGKLTIVRNSSTYMSSGKLAIFFIKFSSTLSISAKMEEVAKTTLLSMNEN